VEQLIGREAELEAVHEALAGSVGVGTVLRGQAGIGKTALWREGVAEADRRGMRVLMAQPVPAETGLSYTALCDVLAPVADELAGGMPAPQRRALDIVLLRTAADGQPTDERAVGAATLSVLRAVAAHDSLLLAVDDMQWVDGASAAALRFALRRLAGEPLVMLGTRREGPAPTGLEAGFEGARLTHVAVGPLSADALQKMLRSRLGDALPRPALKRVVESSGGNPYFALELGRAAVRQRADGHESDGIALPEGMQAVLQARLEGLPPETTQALGTVAAMGDPSMAVVAQAVDYGQLDAAFAAGIVEEHGRAIRFEHPLLAEVAYRMLPPSQRLAVHGRLASIATDAEERARHLAASAAQPDAAVALDIERGAELAAARGARAAAAELLEESARLDPDPTTSARRRVDAVRYLTAGGDARRASALGHDVVGGLPPGPERARALLALAEIDAELDRMLSFAGQAVAEAEDDRELLIEALLLQCVLLQEAGRDAEAGESAVRARALCRPDDSRELRCRVLTEHGFLLYQRGDPDAIDVLREATALEGDDLIPNASFGPGALLGLVLVYADELDEARLLLEPRYRRAGELGDDESVAGLSLYLAEIEIRAGHLDAALSYADDGLAIQQASYGEDATGSLTYGPALVAAYRGDVERARSIGQRGLAQTEAHGSVTCASAIRSALGFLEVSLGESEAAWERLRPLADDFRSGTQGDPGSRHNVVLPYAIEALIEVGRLDEAAELIALLERAGTRGRSPRIPAAAARCRALLHAAEGELEAALEHATIAAELHDGLPVPFERARTLIVLGSVLRRAKQKAAARSALEDAIRILDQMGVPLWVERARAELGRIGGRAQADGLTPTEQRVAELVAEGRSNKEVAGELFVTVRTVEANLTRVYAKLGIRSRTELAAIGPASDGRYRSPVSQPAPRS
jgi:DNA-binding CsgD family transcriptional regulator